MEAKHGFRGFENTNFDYGNMIFQKVKSPNFIFIKMKIVIEKNNVNKKLGFFGEIHYASIKSKYKIYKRKKTILYFPNSIEMFFQ